MPTTGSLIANAPQEINLRLKPVQDQYEAQMVKRFGKLAQQINEKIIDDEFLGGRLVANAYDYPQKAEKVTKFMEWLAAQEDKGILEIVSYEGRTTVVHTGWQNTYVKRSYSKGIEWADKRMKELGISPPDSGAISAVLGGPVHADALGLMYTRDFNALKGVTAAMDKDISRVLADGLAQGKNPRAIASDLAGRNGVVKNIGLTRARTIARTETAYALDEATLNRYTDFKVEEVEWIYSGGLCPSNVCPDGAAESPYKTSESHGILPSHPNCGCAWGPVV